MRIAELPIHRLKAASWNSNFMSPVMIDHLRESVVRFGLIENLVVRPAGDGSYEVLSGNHRLSVAMEMGLRSVSCTVVDLDDAEARLVAQALNHIHGEEDPGLRSQMLKRVLESYSQEEVLALLPETPRSFQALTSIDSKTLAEELADFEQRRKVAIKHVTFHLTSRQINTVKEVLNRFMSAARELDDGGPNVRSRALYLLCKSFLERENKDDRDG